ncbi:MAG: site-2 protease family protein [Candidatus Aminicenantes bacterium]|nr:site-2 protease family protein [Candidatus Aminicenantes bacterium]
MDQPENNPGIRPRRRPSFFSKDRTWLNILLFVITAVSIFFVGITWSLSYKYADSLSQPEQIPLNLNILKDPQIMHLSFLYAVVLIGILLAHEMGHYLTCRYYKVSATLPFFIPAPTLIGTLGAFIKIRSPIKRKHQLFDIGVAGPLAGFVLAVPAVIYGLSLSKLVPPLPQEGTLLFGEPLFINVLGGIIFKGAASGKDVVVHPVAFAGWVGLLVTALNLFPIGQLDGGHVLYALIGPRVKKFARFILIGFVIMGVFFWMGWFVWALLISFLGLKHPPVMDENVSLSSGRKWLSFVVLVIFLVSFIPAPVKGYSLIEILPSFL